MKSSPIQNSLFLAASLLVAAGAGAQDTNRYAGIDADTLPALKRLEETDSRTATTWMDLTALHRQMVELNRVFGRKARPDAMRKLAPMTAESARLRDRFNRDAERILRPVSRQVETLRDRISSEQIRMEKAPVESAVYKASQEKLDSLFAESRSLTQMQDDLDLLSRRLDTSGTLPDRLALIGVVVDPYSTPSIAGMGDLIEARHGVQDVLADIEMIRTSSGTGTNSPAVQRLLQEADADLVRALDRLEKQAVRHLAPIERDIAALEKTVEAMKEKVNAREKPNERLMTELSDKDRSLSTLRIEANFIRTLAQPALAKKAAANPPPK